MAQRVLITGGAGFIGRHLVDAALERGHAVRILDDLSASTADGLPDAAEFVNGDIRRPADLERALRGVDGVLHHAALPSVPGSLADPVGAADVNLTGTIQLLNACQAAGVRRIVFASSSAVYGEPVRVPVRETDPPAPLSPYGVHKLAAEHLLRVAAETSPIDTVSFRYFNVFGPGQSPHSAYAAAIPRFHQRLAAAEPAVIFGDGAQTRDFIHVTDVARLNIAALDATAAWGGLALNVGSGEATSIRELASILARLHGQPDDPTFEPARPGDILDSVASVEALHAALAARGLAWTPEISLEDGLSTLPEPAPAAR